jgi:hypothetical protein
MSETSEYEPQNDGESMVAGGNGVAPYDASEEYGFDDDDLDAAEYDEEAGDGASSGGGGVATTSEVDLADLELRVQDAEEYKREREAARLHPKVIAGTATGTIAAAVGASLPLLDGINLPDGVEQIIAVVIVLISTFVAGYLKSGRPAPGGLGA